MRTTMIAVIFALQAAVIACGSGATSKVNTTLGSSPHPGSSNPTGNPNTGAISIFPATETLRIGGQRRFSGWDSSVGQYDVTWSLKEGAAAGGVSADGLYTAPSTPGIFHLMATSSHNASLSATAALSIVNIGFVTVGSMATARVGHTATLLGAGTVLVAGGTSGATPSAELFNPASSSFISTSSAMVYPRSGHCATLLPNGWALIVGGGDGHGNFFRTAELFDPVVQSFTATGDLNQARTGATATTLPNGKVLIAGGQDSSGRLLSSAELYDLSTGTFTLTGSMHYPRSQHTATLLANGKVLILGNMNDTDNAELYDPVSGVFSATGSLIQARAHNTATLLPNGNVLVAGGTRVMPPGGGGAPAAPVSLDTVEIYDPARGIFQSVGRLHMARDSHSATLLANGTVLLDGGFVHDFDGDAQPEWYTIFTAEAFDPTNSVSTVTASLEGDRAQHLATTLNDGKVLITGGISGFMCCSPNGSTVNPYAPKLSSVEVYK
jgi:Galactose oxidase, central domain